MVTLRVEVPKNMVSVVSSGGARNACGLRTPSTGLGYFIAWLAAGSGQADGCNSS
jgi:hypothetical protein